MPPKYPVGTDIPVATVTSAYRLPKANDHRDTRAVDKAAEHISSYLVGCPARWFDDGPANLSISLTFVQAIGRQEVRENSQEQDQ